MKMRRDLCDKMMVRLKEKDDNGRRGPVGNVNVKEATKVLKSRFAELFVLSRTFIQVEPLQ